MVNIYGWYKSYILIRLLYICTAVPIFKHLSVDLVADSIDQQVMEDIPHIQRPVEEQLEEHFFQQVCTQVLSKLQVEHIVMRVQHDQRGFKHK